MLMTCAQRFCQNDPTARCRRRHFDARPMSWMTVLLRARRLAVLGWNPYSPREGDGIPPFKNRRYRLMMPI